MNYGAPSRRVCWLVQPTAYDKRHMPPHYTLVYEIREPFGSSGFGRPGQLLAMSIDREEIAEFSKDLYRARQLHQITTHWYDHNGCRISKPEYVKTMKRMEMAE